MRNYWIVIPSDGRREESRDLLFSASVKHLKKASPSTPRARPAKMCRRQPLIEGARRVLAIALDLDFLFALSVFAIIAAIFVVSRNYTLARLVPALLSFIRHGDVPFQQPI